ncbi:hypothetical protein [Nocardia sp. CA-119907]|uniref:hypothetical protein n=1 Tax=Nocardia sp. CA-119907 TaxID=3239973 RepID=UPI003D97F95D
MPAELKVAIVVAAVLVMVGITTYALVQIFGPRARPENAVPASEILERLKSDRSTSHSALAISHTVEEADDDDRIGWIQFADGSWAAVDGDGNPGDEFTIPVDELPALHADVVIAVEPASVVDIEVAR